MRRRLSAAVSSAAGAAPALSPVAANAVGLPLTTLPCLHAQAQFLAEQAGAQPAARVTRVSRKQPQQPATPPPEQQQLQPQGGVQPHAASSSAAAAATAGPAPAEAATPTATPVAQHQQQEEEQMCPAIPGILSDVKERVLTGSVVEPPAASAAAAISAASSASFPKAVHRKQSKVGVGCLFDILV